MLKYSYIMARVIQLVWNTLQAVKSLPTGP